MCKCIEKKVGQICHIDSVNPFRVKIVSILLFCLFLLRGRQSWSVSTDLGIVSLAVSLWIAACRMSPTSTTPYSAALGELRLVNSVHSPVDHQPYFKVSRAALRLANIRVIYNISWVGVIFSEHASVQIQFINSNVCLPSPPPSSPVHRRQWQVSVSGGRTLVFPRSLLQDRVSRGPTAPPQQAADTTVSRLRSWHRVFLPFQM